MTCDVISTGSVGNAVLLNGKYLFDCGVSYEKLKPYVKKLAVVFLTHVHADHFKIQTIRRLHRERPLVKFVCGRNLLVPLCTWCGVEPGSVVMAVPGEPVTLFYGPESLRIQSFDLIHNVENIGYAVEVAGGDGAGKALYATDTQYIPVCAPGFDLYMVECNYHAGDLERRRERKRKEGKFLYEDTVEVSHMSYETVSAWLRQNAGPDSRVVFLHQHVEKEATGNDPMDSGIFQSAQASEDL